MSTPPITGDRWDIDKIIHRLRHCELLTEDEISQLCEKVIEILSLEDNVVKISTPIIICGDLHGQFHDLLQLLSISGDPCGSQKYIFLGDYVDRGQHSVETICLLFALKVKYPQNITLTRGNHESTTITQVYGFYDEVLSKYNSVTPWLKFTNTFNYLPLCGLIEDFIFCTHGGLSPSIQEINQIADIDRYCPVPTSGSMADLLWSDPFDAGQMAYIPATSYNQNISPYHSQHHNNYTPTVNYNGGSPRNGYGSSGIGNNGRSSSSSTTSPSNSYYNNNLHNNHHYNDQVNNASHSPSSYSSTSSRSPSSSPQMRPQQRRGSPTYQQFRGWAQSPRSVGWIFGEDVTRKFNHINGLSAIARAHQMAIDGYCWNHENGIITIFSAPNYGGKCGNRAAVMRLNDDNEYTFISFNHSQFHDHAELDCCGYDLPFRGLATKNEQIIGPMSA